ncbi:MAG: UbiA prenyltransferase family protein [Dehalococcoidales bacterium]
MAGVIQRWMGQGNVVKPSYNVSDRLAGVLDITRPVLSTMGALGVGAGAALAYGGFPTWSKCLVGVIAALLAFAGIHAFNDFVDKRRDVVCWPGRPIPSKRLAPPQALFFALASFTAALVIVWFTFNTICFTVSFLALGLGCLYSSYLRDRVGYLALPPIQSMGWLCGWAAFSPDTLFNSWAPWVLWSFSAAWQAGHIMIYSPLHPIQHVKGMKLTQVPAFIKRTSPRTAAILGFVFLCLASVLSIYLGFYFNLGLLYLLPTALMAVPTLIISFNFIHDPENFAKGIKAFSFATYFMLVARIFILLSVFLFF